METKHIAPRFHGIFWGLAFAGLSTLMAEVPDTTLLKDRIAPKAGTLGIKGKGKKSKLFMAEGGKDKKVYSRGLAAQRFGGAKDISLEKQTLMKRLEKPGSLVKELPPEVRRKAEALTRKKQLERKKGKSDSLGLDGKIETESIAARPALASFQLPEREKEAAKLAAISALGVAKSKSATFHLKENLKDERPQVKRAAAEALAKIGVPVGLEALHTELEEDTSKIETIRALGRVGRVTSIPSLRKQLTSQEKGVGAEAAIALAKMGDQKGITVLKGLLKSASSDERFQAAIALASAGDKSGLSILQKSLVGVHAGARIKAAKALGMIGDKKTISLLEKAMKGDPDSKVRIAASASILKIKRKEK
jgi:HEAT repeat protein